MTKSVRMADPPKKFFRLSPGAEVRFKFAYYITCTDVIKDSKGKIIELHCKSRMQNKTNEKYTWKCN